MAKTQVLNVKGEKVKDLTLKDSVWNAEVNTSVMHDAIVLAMANVRQGTHSTKTRAEVSGGGRKPWRQKGTGNARQGSIRATQWRKGGIAFGPKPRDYSFKMPVKARRLALKSALSARVDATTLVKDFSELKSPKTKDFAKILDTLKLTGKILVIVDTKLAENQHVELAARNLPNVKVILPSNINVKDILEADCIVMSETTVSEITERLTK